jgi:acyl-CoA dehydrogenase
MSQSHVPSHDRSSFWERDPVLRRAVARVLPAEEFASAEETFGRIGAASADEIDRLAAVVDREVPRLIPRDPTGERIDYVDYHPSYRRLEDLAYGEFRLVALKYDPQIRERQVAHRIGFVRSILFGMGEAGLLCPVCMTDGVARVLEHADPQLAATFVPKLCFGAGEPRNTGAMFLTEKAGGSDVGANETTARQEGGEWLLSGEKWFCSNVDAELILALARPEGAVPGTRGLAMFLIERERQTSDTYRIERLKDLLGTRSKPTGEVILTDAPATLVGSPDAGFKLMTSMLNLSRMYNAAISCSAIGRSWLEAKSFAERRRVFGALLIEQPLAREVLDDLEAEYAGALALVLEGAKVMDLADGGDADAARLLRCLTPLNKLFTGKVAVSAASEGLEFLGGCGYVEDWPTARILRDAQVLPVWEGTTNILSLDLVRVARKEGLDPIFERGRRALEASTAAGLATARDQARAHLSAAEEGIAACARGEGIHLARRLAFRLARGLQAALLLEAAGDDAQSPEGRSAARLAARAGGPCIAS